MKGPKPTDVVGLRCESIGCIYQKGGRIIALVKESAALSDDCPKANVLISRSPVKRWRCLGPQILIDRFDLWRNGPHAIFFGADKMEVRSVGAAAGTRPWQIYPRSRRRK